MQLRVSFLALNILFLMICVNPSTRRGPAPDAAPTKLRDLELL